MENRFVVSIIIGTLIGFFGSWAVYGIALGDYYANHTRAEAFAVVKDPPEYWALAVSSFAWVTLMAVYIRFTDHIGFARGFTTGLWISLLVLCILDFWIYGFFSIYGLVPTLVDLVTGVVFWSLIAGIVGAIQKWKVIKPTPTE